MSRLETFLTLNPIDYIPASLGSLILGRESNHPWPSTTVASSAHLVTKPLYDESPTKNVDDDAIYPGLPPLLVGHPDIHIRIGIMNSLRMAAAQIPDSEKAFFVADLSQIYQQHKRWKACLPEITPFYGGLDYFFHALCQPLYFILAVKCNPDPYVIRLLAALGAGFDCASNNEISQVLAVGGIEPSNIIYANPCKAASFIRNAAKVGVDLMTFDNSDELKKISRVHPGAKCVVRILTDDSKSLCAFGIKFGAALTAVPALLKTAKELNLDVVGVSFHVGSGCYDPTVYKDAISRARRVFDMGREAGYVFSLLDIGGGFEDALFEQAAEVLRISLEQYFPDQSDIKIIAEPGRFYVSKAFKLAVNIIARRVSPKAPTSPFGDNTSSPSDQPAVMCESRSLEIIASSDDLVLLAKKKTTSTMVFMVLLTASCLIIRLSTPMFSLRVGRSALRMMKKNKSAVSGAQPVIRLIASARKPHYRLDFV